VNSPALKLASLKVQIKSVLIPVVTLLLALVLTIGRAFNTDDINSLHRFGLWLTVCALVAVQVLIFMHVLHRYVFKSRKRAQLLSKVGAVVLTILVMAIELHFLKYTPILPKHVDPPLEFLSFVWLPISVISVIFILLYGVRGHYSVNIPSMDAGRSRLNKSAEDKLDAPPEWRQSKTLRVQVEDHYLRIYNEHKQFFIRGKMSEAIELLEAKEGTQVHRSHWVSFEFIDEIEKQGRDYHLKLNNGDRVPVSRGRASEVLKNLEKFNALLKN